MSSLELAERWAKRFVLRPHARSRLFCFPYAGVGASALRRWMNFLPADVEVRPIEYPGRWTRDDEPLCDSVESLADGAAVALSALLDRPYAVMGYSLGALVAYEWLRRVARENQPSPEAFFVCAQRAPHLPPTAQLHVLSDAEFYAAVERKYGKASDVAIDGDVMAQALPILRADIRARERYVCHETASLGVRLRAYGGADDASVSADDLAAWGGYAEADFACKMFPGGHFFINSVGESLAETIAHELSAAGLA